MKTGGIAEQQGALEVLGTLKSPESRKLLSTISTTSTPARMAPVLHIDLVDAVQTDGSRALQKRLDAYQRKQQADALIKAFRAGTIAGGDARKGQQVLFAEPARRVHALPRHPRPRR